MVTAGLGHLQMLFTKNEENSFQLDSLPDTRLEEYLG